MKILEKTADEIKSQIVDAAFARFGRYGWSKTTMAEIAGDCDMSAGNLYRYYENKTEIGAGCARRCFSQKEGLLREVLRRPDLTASRRLEVFVLETLHCIFGEFSKQPLLVELVIFISRERMDLVGHHMGVQRSLIAEILAEGNKAGEFDVADVLTASEMIQTATIKFSAPHFMSMFSLDQLECEAKGVVGLLIKGLAKQ